MRIGFIGAGQMARALAAGFVRAGLTTAEHVWAADPLPAAREAFSQTLPGAHVEHDSRKVAEAVDVVLLAVKPQNMAAACEELRSTLSDQHLVISIAAGVTTQTIASRLEPGVRLVRVMPNTPCLVGQSASGYSLGAGATPEDGQLVGRLFEAVGRALPLEEKLLDAVTGLAGSGPAFVFIMIEALSDGGVLMGLPRDVATELAAQTLRGAATMVLETGEHPADLKDRVASPAGTTISGLEALEAGGLRAALISAVEAATLRSIELGRG